MQLPEGKTLYDILDLTKDQVKSDESLVRKAYRKLALKYHPDKQASNSAQQIEHANEQFLLVGYAYSILSDSEKRIHYDLTGGSDEFNAFFSGGKDWTNYFKSQWQGVVSTETIEAHALKYKGSAEEEEDVLRYYTQCKGNMNQILAHVEHSKATDVGRFMELIQAAIENNRVDVFPAYDKTTSTTAQMRRLKREEAEAAMVEQEAQQKKQSNDSKWKQQQGVSDNSIDEIESSMSEEEDDIDDDESVEDTTLESLEDTIHARQRERASKLDDMVANLEKMAKARSATNKKKGKGRASAVDNIGDSSASIKDDDDTTTKPSADSNDRKTKKTGSKDHQTTINTQTMTMKQTKQTRTKTTTADPNTDATTTTTSVVTKSKKLTKFDRKKRKHGTGQHDTDSGDKETGTDDSTALKNKKTRKVDLSEKPSHHTRSQRRKSTKDPKSSTH